MAEHPHDLMAGNLDLPALVQLADHELGVGVDEQAVVRWALARTLDTAGRILESSDEGLVLGVLAGHVAAKTQADHSLLSGSGL